MASSHHAGMCNFLVDGGLKISDVLTNHLCGYILLILYLTDFALPVG